MAISFEKLENSDNLTPFLDDTQLAKIGSLVVNGYEIDEESRAEWKETIEPAMKIAKQVVEPKTYPWVGASNIKYPLITEASIDFAARTMPEIIQNDRIVKCKISGKDPDGQKALRCYRVSDYMSYQLLYESDDWEVGMDKTIQCLAILGTIFKKTYYCPIEGRSLSELCVPDKITVNYSTNSLESARRITHAITMYTNDIMERQAEGLFNDEIEADKLLPSPDSDMSDEDHPIELLEQHCYLDLDEDGYKEPYIVTVHKESRQILRIVSRFKEVERTKKGKIKRIVPEQYFTDYHFIHSPDGGYYSMGFGQLLLPINKAINTIFNQLIDAGTLSNTQGGLIGKGLRLKNGEFKVRMNEWKVVDTASGTDLGKNIFPFPVKEPSQTLFQLLQLLMQVGRDLSSSTDALQGKEQVQNVSSNAMNQMVEQGSKMFGAINKRIYRSLKKEYAKLYNLNYKYLSNKDYKNVLDDEQADVKRDFEPNTLDIMPVADPTMSSSMQKFARAQAVQGLRSIDVRAADQYLLESMQIDQDVIKKLLPEPDPQAPPPPEVQKIQAEIEFLQAQVGEISAKATLAAEQNKLKSLEVQQALVESESRVQESMARVTKMGSDAANGRAKIMIAANKAQSEHDYKNNILAHQITRDRADFAAELKANEDKSEAAKGAVAVSAAKVAVEKEALDKDPSTKGDE
jgi:chaperonin GroES